MCPEGPGSSGSLPGGPEGYGNPPPVIIYDSPRLVTSRTRPGGPGARGGNRSIHPPRTSGFVDDKWGVGYWPPGGSEDLRDKGVKQNKGWGHVGFQSGPVICWRKQKVVVKVCGGRVRASVEGQLRDGRCTAHVGALLLRAFHQPGVSSLLRNVCLSGGDVGLASASGCLAGSCEICHSELGMKL
eukprot:768607-Hanusia_phi.AAC.1